MKRKYLAALCRRAKRFGIVAAVSGFKTPRLCKDCGKTVNHTVNIDLKTCRLSRHNIKPEICGACLRKAIDQKMTPTDRAYFKVEDAISTIRGLVGMLNPDVEGQEEAIDALEAAFEEFADSVEGGE